MHKARVWTIRARITIIGRMSKKEDDAYEEGKAHGYEEGYNKATKHAFTFGIVVFVLIVLGGLLSKITGCH